jgi:hypothetical protein
MVHRHNVTVYIDASVDLDQRNAFGSRSHGRTALHGVNRAHDNAVHAPGKKRRQPLCFDLGRVIGVTEEQAHTRVVQGVFDCADDRWEERVDEVRHNHPHCTRDLTA